MNVPFGDLKRQYESIKAELDAAAARVLASGWYILGPEVRAFEAEFAAFCGVGHAIGVGNGTEALYLALIALQSDVTGVVGGGDKHRGRHGLRRRRAADGHGPDPCGNARLKFKIQRRFPGQVRSRRRRELKLLTLEFQDRQLGHGRRLRGRHLSKETTCRWGGLSRRLTDVAHAS